MPRYILTLLFCLVSIQVLAAEQTGAEPAPLVHVDVIVELDAINQALTSTSESLEEISESFVIIAEGGQLGEEQQQQLVTIMDNMNQLVAVTRESVDAMPALVERSRTSLVSQGDRFMGDLKFWIVLILVVVILALAVAAFCFYHFVIRPVHNTLQQLGADFSNITKSMENTSKSLETSNKNQNDLIKLAQQNRASS